MSRSRMPLELSFEITGLHFALFAMRHHFDLFRCKHSRWPKCVQLPCGRRSAPPHSEIRIPHSAFRVGPWTLDWPWRFNRANADLEPLKFDRSRRGSHTVDVKSYGLTPLTMRIWLSDDLRRLMRLCGADPPTLRRPKARSTEKLGPQKSTPTAQGQNRGISETGCYNYGLCSGTHWTIWDGLNSNN